MLAVLYIYILLVFGIFPCTHGIYSTARFALLNGSPVHQDSHSHTPEECAYDPTPSEIVSLPKSSLLTNYFTPFLSRPTPSCDRQWKACLPPSIVFTPSRACGRPLLTNCVSWFSSRNKSLRYVLFKKQIRPIPDSWSRVDSSNTSLSTVSLSIRKISSL